MVDTTVLDAAISICSLPTTKYPDGRTGTRAGYMAHYFAGEVCCPACMKGNAAAVAADKAADPEISLQSNLWYKYRLTLPAYYALLEAQGGTCAICRVAKPTDKRTGRFHVDHDHACCPGKRSCGGCTRGLLCHACNTALGNFQDDPELLERAAAYVRRARGQDRNDV